MFGKTPVTALVEYCAKKNYSLPEFNYTDVVEGNNKSFICKVTVLDIEMEGIGRSKKEAKHDAAANAIKKLKVDHPDIDTIPQAEHCTKPTTDAVAELRNLCLQEDHPFPSFNLVQQSGPPQAPEFTYECRVATITRYATDSTKKGAKQMAAHKILNIIRNIQKDADRMQVSAIENAMETDNENICKKFLTYREFIESDVKEQPGTKLSDRHFFFVKQDPDKLQKARDCLTGPFVSNSERIQSILKHLEITPKQTTVLTSEGDALFIELKCDLDVVFVGPQEEIYDNMISYFHEMLY